MATEQDQLVITVKAEADLSLYQYRAVRVVNSGYGTLALGTADDIIGIQLNKPAARDRALKVAIGGHVKAICGDSSITAGDYVGVHSIGQLRKAEYGLSKIIGQAITDAGGSAEYFEMAIEKWIYYNDI